MAGHDYRSYTDAKDYSYGTSTTSYTLSNVQGQVAVAALRRDKTIVEIAEEIEVHPNRVTTWVGHFLGRSCEAFGEKVDGNPAPNNDKMVANIGSLTLENQ